MKHDDLNSDWRRKAALAALLLAMTVAALLFDRLTSCSAPSPGPGGPGTETGTGTAADCDGIAIGDFEEEACANGQAGKVITFCTPKGLQKTDTCVPPNSGPGDPVAPGRCGPDKTTFAAVQPILSRSCDGCHRGYDSFDKASAAAQEFLRRMRLPLADAQHMPKGSDLPAGEIETFADWIADGLCEKTETQSPGGGGLGFQSFDASESVIVSDLTDTSRVDIEERDTTRYLVATDVINAGGSAEELAAYKQAAEKAINSVSPERDMARLVDVAPGIWRFDMDDIGMNAREWRALEIVDLVNIESRTSRGELLKLLTKTRKPWVHVATLIDSAFRSSALYYDLIEMPTTFSAFTEQLGVDFAGDLRQRKDVVLSAFNNSPLSTHNRMISVHRSRDGAMFCTYDTGPQDDDLKNFTQFPLLADIGGRRDPQFLAGECIHTLPNGLQAFTLWNAQQTFKLVGRVDRNGRPILDSSGRQLADRVFDRSDLAERADVGAVQVVRDFLSPVSSEIRVGISCFRCHAPGILPVRDEIRASVIANGAQFGADLDLVKAVYNQGKMDEQIARENARYTAALGQLGITAVSAGVEPVTKASDAHLLPWSEKKVCATLWIEASQCRVLLNQSATAQVQWGQLATGGTISFDQFVQSLPAVIEELRLFQDQIAN